MADQISIRTKEELPNEETISAMLESERIAKDINIKGYHDVDELFTDLDS